MPNVNPDTLVLEIPTTGPQRYVDAQGNPISLVVTEANPDVVDELDPNDVFLSQPQSGPPVLKNADGTTPDMNAAVLTPYSLVTPPGVLVVG